MAAEERTGDGCVVVLPSNGSSSSNGHITPLAASSIRPLPTPTPPPVITIPSDKDGPSSPPLSSMQYRHNNGNSESPSRDRNGKRMAAVSPGVTRIKNRKPPDGPPVIASVRVGSRHGYPPVSPAAPRPGTAPASPAIGRGSLVSPSVTRARHSAPNSPALAHQQFQQHNGSSQASSPGQSSRLTSPTGGLPTSPSSVRDPPNTANAFSRKNVANKRLRKENDTQLENNYLMSEERPSKRHKGSYDSINQQACKPALNGDIVELDDNNSVDGSSSGSGYCEVIDSVVLQPSKPLTSTMASTSMSNSLRRNVVPQHPTWTSSSNSLINNESIVNDKCTNQPKPRRGRPSSRRGASVSSSHLTPSASDVANLPGASRITPGRNYATDHNSNVSVNNECVATKRDSIINVNAGSGGALPSSSRSGRGRGRRRSRATNSGSTSELKLPTSKSKVKTTSQLVAELAQRKGDTLLAQQASRLEEQQKSQDEMARNKMDHMIRYVRSLPSPPELTCLSAPRSPSPIIISPEPVMSDQPTTTITTTTPEPLPVPAAPPEEDEPPTSVLDLLGATEDDTESLLLAKLPPVDFAASAAADRADEIAETETYGHTGN